MSALGYRRVALADADRSCGEVLNPTTSDRLRLAQDDRAIALAES